MRSKLHYGWIICVGCLLLHACTCGLTATCFSAYLPYIKTALALNNTQTSLIVTMRSLSSMLAMLTCNRYYKLFSLRIGVVVSCLFLVVSCLMFAWASSIFMCYLAAAIMGIAYAYGTMVPISFFMRNWFADRRSTALAIAACGSGVTTAIAPTIITNSTETFGLTRTFLAEAGIVAVCAALLFLILRDSPADLNLAPYRQGDRQKEKQQKAPALRDVNLSRRETRLLMFTILLVGCLGAPYLSHLTLHYRNVGYTSTQTAAALSMIGIVMIGGKFLFGVASDRFGSYRINYLFLGSWLLACGVTTMLNGVSLELLYFATFLSGIGISLGTIGITVWVGDLSSEENYAKNITSSQFAFSLGALVWSPIPGILADLTGGYEAAYVIFGVMVALTMIIVQAIYRRHVNRD